jgi:hypothetical protein
MKRPGRTMIPNLNAIDRDVLAKRAVYAGSVEHKDKASWLGLPQLRRDRHSDGGDHRQNASVCRLVGEEDKERATQWVQHAIRNGQFDPNIWAGDFPRDIWHLDADGKYWRGRLTQIGAGDDARGEYKGWPITRDEWLESFGGKRRG